MAHKTLVNSTEYDITGGKTLVEGTSYSVKNGKVLVGGTEYDISFLLPPAALNLWNGTESSVNCILYADGYWVVGGSCYEGQYHARIAYATELNGTWTTKNIASGHAKNMSVNCITYANGYWTTAIGYSATRYLYVYYATSPGGTWSSKKIWTGYGDYPVATSIIYANGYWAVCVRDYDGDYYNARISYATSLSGTWNSTRVWHGGYESNYLNCITYANGYWVVGGSYTTSGDQYARIAYSTALDGSWTIVNIWSDDYSRYYTEINCVTYANGYWVAGGRLSEAHTYARIAYATSLSGEWTVKDLWSDSISAASPNEDNIITSIDYLKGRWVVGGRYFDNTYSYARIAYSTSLSGTWTIVDLSDGLEHSINDITYGDGYIVAGGIYYYGGATYARIYYSPTLKGFEEIVI